jgi:hypothetical protein
LVNRKVAHGLALLAKGVQGSDERRQIFREGLEVRGLDGEIPIGELLVSSTGSRARELDARDCRVAGDQAGCDSHDVIHRAIVAALRTGATSRHRM